MMDMRRINARNYAVYLQRRVEDHFDADRPLPKWTEIDREAVHEVVREFRRLERNYDLALEELERNYDLALEELERNGLTAPQVFDDEIEPDESAWMAAPLPPRETGSKWWQFWR